MRTILGIAGSLRLRSHNRRLLEAAARKLPDGDALVVWEGLGDLPPFSEDAEDDPAADPLRAAIAAADAVLFAVPEYNGSIPGQLKNALDWVSRPLETNPLRGKRVAVIGASTGLFGAVWSQADLRRVLGVIGADVLDRELPVGLADTAFAPAGDLADPAADAALTSLIEALLPERTPHAPCAADRRRAGGARSGHRAGGHRRPRAVAA